MSVYGPCDLEYIHFDNAGLNSGPASWNGPGKEAALPQMPPVQMYIDLIPTYGCDIVKNALFIGWDNANSTPVNTGPNTFTCGPGATLQRPSEGNCNIEWNPVSTFGYTGADPDYTNYLDPDNGFLVASVSVLTILADGSFVSRGSIHFGQVAMGPPALHCVGSDGTFDFLFSTEHVIKDELTGDWPIVVGENNVASVRISVGRPNTNIFNAWFGEINIDDACAPGNSANLNMGEDVYQFNGGWRSFTLETPQITGINIFQGVTDFQDYFCCSLAGQYDCGCGAPPVSNPPPSFLIPRPPSPELGDENVSTPPLFTPLSLSNYTFQFIRDFGRVK